MEGAAKNIYPGFSRAAGNRRGDAAAHGIAAAMLPPSTLVTSPVVLSHRMVQKGLRYVLGRNLAFGIAVLQQQGRFRFALGVG